MDRRGSGITIAYATRDEPSSVEELGLCVTLLQTFQRSAILRGVINNRGESVVVALPRPLTCRAQPTIFPALTACSGVSDVTRTQRRFPPTSNNHPELEEGTSTTIYRRSRPASSPPTRGYADAAISFTSLKEAARARTLARASQNEILFHKQAQRIVRLPCARARTLIPRGSTKAAGNTHQETPPQSHPSAEGGGLASALEAHTFCHCSMYGYLYPPGSKS